MAKKEKKDTVDKVQKKKSDSKKESVPQEIIVPRLFDKYNKEIAPGLFKQFSYKNVMQVPKLQKIVLNMGTGQAVQDPKILDEAIKELETISGQKASVRLAKKSISNFKLR